MSTCLLQSEKDNLVAAFKSGDLDMGRLYDMGNDEAHGVLSKIVGEDSAGSVNAEFQKAKISAQKVAAADYVSASDKANFTRQSAQGEFGKKLLSPEKVRELTAAKIDERVAKLQALHDKLSPKLGDLKGEDKANAQIKLNKIQDQIDRAGVRKENVLNPTTDALLNKIRANKDLLASGDYQDLVEAKMGQKITPAESKYILQKSDELQELAKANKTAPRGVTPEYLLARSNLDSFINSLNPDKAGTNIVKNYIEMVKNSYIMSISTPLKTLESALLNHPAGAAIRRLSHLSGGVKDGGFIKQQVNASFRDFRTTKVNDLSMQGIDDTNTVLGSHSDKFYKGQDVKGILDEASSNEKFNELSPAGKAKGVLGLADRAVAKTAGIYHKIAIEWEHNYTFTYMYGKVFGDALRFNSLDMAKAEGLKGDAQQARALEIVKDAFKVEPETDAGQVLRDSGQFAAAKALNVGDTWSSRISVGIKNALNSMNPKIPLGTWLEPFGKIPTNVVEYNVRATPVGVPVALWDMVRGKVNMAEGKPMETRYEGALQVQKGLQNLIGIVGSVAVAQMLTHGLTQKDFRSDTYGNHFVRYGNTWINTIYFGRAGANIAGTMAAKANGGKGGVGGEIQSYLIGAKAGQGALGGYLQVPGVNEIHQAVSTVLGPKSVKSLVGGTVAGVLPIPAGLQNLFKSRPGFRLFFGANGVETDAQYQQDLKASAAKAAATRAANKKIK